jgi:hypothetical protein
MTESELDPEAVRRMLDAKFGPTKMKKLGPTKPKKPPTFRFLVRAGVATEDGHRVGGAPLLPAGTAWPMCGACARPQQHVGQLSLPLLGLGDGRLVAFMCVTPGCAGRVTGGRKAKGLAVIAVQGPAVALERPQTAPPEAPAVGLEPRDVTPSPSADLEGLDGWKLRVQHRARAWASIKDIAMGIVGKAEWLGDDETPKCCKKKLTFVAQLEWHGHLAYVFTCGACATPAMLAEVRGLDALCHAHPIG